MRVIMVSDAHLEGLSDPNQAALVAWLDGLSVDRVFLLGDIFHHWWGYRGVVPSAYVPICAALLRLKQRGIPVVFVPGNHDFAVGDFLRQDVGLDVRSAHHQDLDGARFYLAHGDEADQTLGYRLTRAVLRGPVFAGLMRVLGPVRGERLLRRLAGSSRHHPADVDSLLEAQQRWADQFLSEGADVVVMGHVHMPALVRRSSGLVVHLGDWVEHRSFLEVDEGRPRLFRIEADGARVEIPEGACP
jgi:UDP-2,3-diacylglucosamine hydrolase